tara:strand:+ start:383 stop:1156 length:774 start_codon:yes stop_codon:yes gene_type:complete
MITAALQGGLGNQMFQIAAASSLAWHHDDIAKFNLDNHYLPLQGRNISNYVDNVFRGVDFTGPFNISTLYKEPQHSYVKIPYQKDLMIHGYFQSEKYFKDHSAQIRELFSAPRVVLDDMMERYGDHVGPEVASIHVRRGDYLKFQDIHPLCTKEYYREAMSRLSPSTRYLIFSDDVEWCLRNFKMKNFKVIEGEADYIDMYLMSLCGTNIIANSSFSWWSAWLNPYSEKKIFAPLVWFGPKGPREVEDLVPESWERI